MEGFRSERPEETLEFIESTGIDRELGLKPVSERGEGDAHVVVFRNGKGKHHAGKGTSKTQARVSGVMEAVERDRCRYDESRVIRDPDDPVNPYPEAYRGEPNRWVDALTLPDGEHVQIPIEEVFHPVPEAIAPTHTNGLAAGRTRNEAIVQGLLEVIERDAWSVHEERRAPVEQLDVTGTDVEKVVDSVEAVTGYRPNLRLLPSRVEGVHVVGAVLDTGDPDTTVMGMGASPIPEMAAVRAVLESLQGFELNRLGIESPVRKTMSPELRDILEEKLTPERFRRMNAHWFKTSETVHIDDLERKNFDDVESLLNWLVDRTCEGLGGPVLVADLPDRFEGVHVVRVRVIGALETAVDGVRGRRGTRRALEQVV